VGTTYENGSGDSGIAASVSVTLTVCSLAVRSRFAINPPGQGIIKLLSPRLTMDVYYFLR
jgi:hypothetical protein